MSRGCRCCCSGATAPLLLSLAPVIGGGGVNNPPDCNRTLRNCDGISLSNRRQLRFVRFGPDLVRDLASMPRSMTTAPAQQRVIRRDVHALHCR